MQIRRALLRTRMESSDGWLEQKQDPFHFRGSFLQIIHKLTIYNENDIIITKYNTKI